MQSRVLSPPFLFLGSANRLHAYAAPWKNVPKGASVPAHYIYHKMFHACRTVQADSEPRSLDLLEKRIGYVFRDRSLLQKAMTHPSYESDHPEEGRGNNQRLEFLGDAVLGITIGEVIFNKSTDIEGPGVLTRQRSVLVNGKMLACLAKEVKIDTCMRLGKGEELQGGKKFEYF